MLLYGIVTGVLLGGIYSLLALGLSLIFGVMRIINIAHGEFMVLSAFIVFTLASIGIDPIISPFIILPLFFSIGMLAQRFIIAPLVDSPPALILVVTMGLAFSLRNTGLIIWGVDERSISIPILESQVPFGDISIGLGRILAFSISLACALGIYALLNKTNLGKAIRACAQDREAAMTLGINYNRIAMTTFGIGTAAAALVGPLIGLLYAFNSTVGLDFTLKSFAVIILGGLGSIPGAIFGGLLLGVAESVGTLLLPIGYEKAIAFAVIIVVLVLKPSGMLGEVKE